MLLSSRFEQYLPMYSEQSRSRRLPDNILRKPLWPGYVFTRFDYGSSDRVAVLQTPGVLDILKVHNGCSLEPAIVTEDDLAQARVLEAAGAIPAPARIRWKPGQFVCIPVGHALMEGVIERIEDEWWACVQVKMFGRPNVMIRVDLGTVKPIAA